MKFRIFLITSSLLLSGLAWAGPNEADHKPMHGGVLTTVKDIDYELVANPTTLRPCDFMFATMARQSMCPKPPPN
jgi:hypothetical protein